MLNGVVGVFSPLFPRLFRFFKQVSLLYSSIAGMKTSPLGFFLP
jgi:hypothetical protein